MKNHKVLVWGTILLVFALVPASGQEKAKKKAPLQPVIELPFPMGGTAEGPATAADKKDLSMYGPGGACFVYLEDKNLEPKEPAEAAATCTAGPGEPGFICEEQPNLYPGEPVREKKPVVKETKPKK